MTLKLHNNYSNVEYVLTLSAIAVATNPDVYQLDIVMPEGADFGEYNYTLLNDSGKVIEQGILQYRPSEIETPEEYGENSNEYTVYTGE